MKRVALFLATNIAVLRVLSLSMGLLGVEPYLNERGLNLNGLLIFAAIFGFGGSFISLAISKWSAKKLMAAKAIAALEKLSLVSGQPPLPDKIAAFGVAGAQGLGIKRLFMTHPPLAERIAALRHAR
ncbi:MAG: hypothetical protein IH605_20805 [Burkholderiales bacterium]|nr:hypothetical protein [Burkholderiales bacterium]